MDKITKSVFIAVVLTISVGTIFSGNDKDKKDALLSDAPERRGYRDVDSWGGTIHKEHRDGLKYTVKKIEVKPKQNMVFERVNKSSPFWYGKRDKAWKLLNDWWGVMLLERLKRFQTELDAIRSIHKAELFNRRNGFRVKIKGEEDIGVIETAEKREEIERAATDALVKDGVFESFQNDIDKLRASYHRDLSYLTEQWQWRINEATATKSKNKELSRILDDAEDWRGAVRAGEEERIRQLSDFEDGADSSEWVKLLRGSTAIPVPSVKAAPASRGINDGSPVKILRDPKSIFKRKKQ